MKGRRARAVLLLLVAAGAALGWWWSQRGGVAPGEAQPAATAGPVATVQVTPIRREKIEETLTAYGTVIAAPGEARAFSVPFESRVSRVFVTPGQVVAAGDPLIGIEPSPDTRQKFEEAVSELDAAHAQLKLLQERLKLKLATRPDLLPAEERVRTAEIRLQSLKRNGVGGPRTIRAEAPGVVSRLDVQQKQIVPAGGALLEMIRENQISVRLGIESEDVASLSPGQAVCLSPVNLPQGVCFQGRLRLITREIDPQTRLVNVFVQPEPGARLMLNEYVRGQIVTATGQALVVPRGAVLPAEGRFLLYTVERGRAVAHRVSLGLENPQKVEVRGEGLRENDPAVVVGNSQLRGGMAVRVEQP